MPTYFVEQLAPTAALPDLRDDLTRLLAAARPASGAAAVRWLYAAYVPAREACLLFAEADDLGTVVCALDAAQVRGAVVPALVLHSPDREGAA